MSYLLSIFYLFYHFVLYNTDLVLVPNYHSLAVFIFFVWFTIYYQSQPGHSTQTRSKSTSLKKNTIDVYLVVVDKFEVHTQEP